MYLGSIEYSLRISSSALVSGVSTVLSKSWRSGELSFWGDMVTNQLCRFTLELVLNSGAEKIMVDF